MKVTKVVKGEISRIASVVFAKYNNCNGVSIEDFIYSRKKAWAKYEGDDLSILYGERTAKYIIDEAFSRVENKLHEQLD